MNASSSLQKIFDKAWEHFIKNDNPPGIDEDGACKYLTNNGRKCAIGLCIPDGHLAQDYDGIFYGVVKHFPELFPDLVNMKKDSLDEFQRRLHDQLISNSGNWAYTKEERKEYYLEIAKDYGLMVPEQSS